VAPLGLLGDDVLKRISVGASLKVCGKLMASLGKGQKVELQASAIEIFRRLPTRLSYTA